MATYIITLVVLLMAVIQSTTSTNINRPDQDEHLRIAIQEMQKANYFAFVMLINMSPLDKKFLGNVTFLMPNDRMLSKTIIPENEVSSFLHRHSIPSPLLFEHLQYIPTGSVLPSSKPEYMLSVSNGGGRRSFFLNNVRIISPNICTAGSPIRCHGIDGVLSSTSAVNSAGSNISLPTCSNNTYSITSASPVSSPPPSPSLVPILPFPDDFPVPAPQPADSSQRNSGSSHFLSDTKLLGTLLVVSMVGVSF
ncbi:hypothetical protein REPUB_Repub16aG0061400 [Reevesia pubescens]